MLSPITARLTRYRLCQPSLFAVLLLIVWLLVTAGTARAASTYTVSGFADSTLPCAGTVCPSLRSAVAAAEADPGSTVKLGNGTYTLGDGSQQPIGSGAIVSEAGLSIVGGGPSSTKIEQTDGEDGVFVFEAGSVKISGVTITGGTLRGGSPSPGTHGADELGAGILSDADLTLDDVVVSGNSATGGAAGAGEGGGAAPNGGDAAAGIANAGALTLIDTSVTGNTATGGQGGAGTGELGGSGGQAVGGILDSGSAGQTSIESNSSISDNTADGGAGGSTDGSTPGSTPLGGYGGTAVGGLLEESDALTISSSSISANTAVGGSGGPGTDVAGGQGGYAVGGVWLIDSSPPAVVESSTLADNIANGGSGGPASPGAGGNGAFATAAITDNADGLTVTASTVSGNVATGGAAAAGTAGDIGGVGGGVLGAAVAESSDGPLMISASSFSDNRGQAGAAGAPNGGGNGTCGAAVFDNGKGSVSLTADTLSGNVAGSSAGALPNGPGGGSEGGGVCFALQQPGTATIVNSTITANIAAGGAGVGTGGAGEGRGGGVWNDQNGSSKVPVTLDDDTLDANSATTSGGNVYLNNGTGLIIASTIVSGGAAGDASTGNCYAPSVTDAGENLESTTPSQCGLGSAHGDLVGANPLLGALASNGGPTETMALDPGSAALGAGGTCAAANGVDQRGLPRPSSGCDIGAFELQPAPTLSGLGESNSRWREGSKQATLSKAKPKRAKVGTTFSFTLNEPAGVVLRFSQIVTGRKVRRKCISESRSNRRKAPCRRTVIAGTLSFATVTAGAHVISFDGRLSSHKTLKPGAYSVTVSATNNGTVTSKPLKFTIVKG